MTQEMNEDGYIVIDGTDLAGMNETATDVEVPELQFLSDGEGKIFVQEAGESTTDKAPAVDDDFGPFQSASQPLQEKAFNNIGFNDSIHKPKEVDLAVGSLDNTLKTSGHMTKAGALLEKIGKAVKGAAGTVKDGIVACYKIAKDNVAKIPSKFMKFCKSVAKAVDNVVKKMQQWNRDRKTKNEMKKAYRDAPAEMREPLLPPEPIEIETQHGMEEMQAEEARQKQKELTKKVIRGAQGATHEQQQSEEKRAKKNSTKVTFKNNAMIDAERKKQANQPEKKSLKQKLKDLVTGGKKKPGERKYEGEKLKLD